MKKMKVAVENLQLTKNDGSKINFWFAPSKLKILNLNETDKQRFVKKETKGVENAPNKK